MHPSALVATVSNCMQNKSEAVFVCSYVYIRLINDKSLRHFLESEFNLSQIRCNLNG